MVQITTLLPVLAALLGAANAHSRVHSLFVDGVDQGDGRNTYIRSPTSNGPVKDVASDQIICGDNNKAVAKWLNVKGGQKVTFEWYHDNRGDDIIDASHKGPVTVYIAPADTDGKGKVWSKIYESGLNNGKWAVHQLIEDRGKHSVTLPSGLAAGKYLLRAEVIGLHEADSDFRTSPDRGAQFYPNCAQIQVSSGGSTKVPGGWGFKTSEGGYTSTAPGILVKDIYPDPKSYTIPGPAVWNGASSGSGPVIVPEEVPEEIPEETPEEIPEEIPEEVPEEEEPEEVPEVPTVPEVPAPIVTRTPVVTPSIPRPTFVTSKPPAFTPTPIAPPAPVKPPTQIPKDRNQCLREANKCFDNAQPKGGLGTPEARSKFESDQKACRALWAECEKL